MHVFINYRREDTAVYAGWLTQLLEDAFGAGSVFHDVDSIGPGVDFVRAIERELDQTDVFLAVIGKDWLTATDTDGNRRLDNARDLVRIEIARALERKLIVIPVLVGDATMPGVRQLPTELAELANRNAFTLSNERFKTDVQDLVDELEKPLREGRLNSGLRYHYRLRSHPDTKIGLITGDIVDVQGVDVWVIPETTDMEMPRVTDGSMQAAVRYRGAKKNTGGDLVEDTIADELRLLLAGSRRVDVNTVLATRAGELESNGVRALLHVAAMVGTFGRGIRLVTNPEQSVRNALKCAESQTYSGVPPESILFPLLGTGLPNEADLAKRQLHEAIEYLDKSPRTSLKTVYFLVWAHKQLRICQELLDASMRLEQME